MIARTIASAFRRLIKRSSSIPRKRAKDPANALERLEWWSWRATIIILAGIIIEAWSAVHFWARPPSVDELASTLVADGLVGAGLLIEAVCIVRAIVWTKQEKDDSDRKVAEAEARASEADLKRVELEARIQPRMTDQRQFDAIQTLRGKVPEVSLIHETDAEPRWFAGSLRGAFFNAGIRVGMYPRAADVHSTGVLIYDPGMRGAKLSEVGETLVDVFRGTGTTLAMITGLPTDVPGAPAKYPAILVGGRFPVLPPHIAKAMQMADAAYAEMKRRGLV